MPMSTTCTLARGQFRSLESWLYSEETRRLGLRSIEVGGETRGRELLRLLLQSHINGRGHGDAGPAVELLQNDPGAGQTLYRQKGLRCRSILTIFGKVRVERVRYARRRGTRIHPLDEQLQLPARSYSYELQSRLPRERFKAHSKRPWMPSRS